MFLSAYSLGLSLAFAAAADSTEATNNNATVDIADLRVLAGDEWTGTLTYLDYSSGKRVTIPSTARVEKITRTTLHYAISYPDEPWEDSKAKLRISKSGHALGRHEIVRREALPTGLTVQTLHDGRDNGRTGQIRMTYNVSATTFVVSKDVRYGDTADFINRNTYTFKRP